MSAPHIQREGDKLKCVRCGCLDYCYCLSAEGHPIRDCGSLGFECQCESKDWTYEDGVLQR